jgi:hypothetical protein
LPWDSKSFPKNHLSEYHIFLSSDSLERYDYRQKESESANSPLQEKVCFVLNLVKMALKQDPESPNAAFRCSHLAIACASARFSANCSGLSANSFDIFLAIPWPFDRHARPFD